VFVDVQECIVHADLLGDDLQHEVRERGIAPRKALFHGVDLKSFGI
jgi:hypothetical protein